MKEHDVFNGLGIEIKLKEEQNFLKIKETLTRMGIPTKEKKLIQSVLLLHKQGRYALLHFKEMFVLDGRNAEITNEDKIRRNLIAKFLSDWGLCEIIDKDKVNIPDGPTPPIKIISYKDKDNWVLESKYSIGKPKIIY